MTSSATNCLPHHKLQILGAHAFQTPQRYYRIAVHSFLSYLHTNFPNVRRLSQLRRDPHLLGWIRCLADQHPPLSNETRRIYLTALRRLLRDLAWEEHSSLPKLILPEDFPPRPSHRKNGPRQNIPRTNAPRSPFQDMFDARVQTLATTLRPVSVAGYRQVARRFLSYLQTDFPHLSELSELRRDPHLLGWLRRLCEQAPRLSNRTRRLSLHLLRRLLHDFAAQGHLQPGLILLEDFPPQPKYLPRPLSPEQDQRLQQELRRTNDLLSNALLLTRTTGIRIGECIDLAQDCLRPMGQNQWALHVPIGKLHTERLVPVDDGVRDIVARILEFREQDRSPRPPQSANFLLPRSSSHHAVYEHLRVAIRAAAERGGCSHGITCHRLRHTYASEMVRLGVSLPALMQLLGHKDIRMTMRYVQVTQQDLQREFHLAVQNATHRHFIPKLPLADGSSSLSSDLNGVKRALGAARHLLEIHRRQLTDGKSQRRLQRLENRLMAVASELDRFGRAGK
jgi:site-specific recombinase XerD